MLTNLCEKGTSKDHLEEDLQELMNRIFQISGAITLAEYDRRLRQEEYKEGKVKDRSSYL